MKQTAWSSVSNQRTYSFLSTHPAGVLATVDPNGNPHATVIYFSIDEDFGITFATKKETKKYDNLQRNSHVQLVVYEMASQTTVQITGVAKDISGTPAASTAYMAMLAIAGQTSDEGTPPISKLSAGQYAAYRIEPRQIRMAVFAYAKPGGYDMYEMINF